MRDLHPGLPDAGSGLFLDFDGTLVPLAPTPDEVQVDPALITLLGALEQRLGGGLAIVSGRPLAEIDRLLKPLRLCVAGVHGAERRTPGGHVIRRQPLDLAAAEAVLAEFCARCRPGPHVERKPGSLALHYRAAPELEEPCLQAMDRALLQAPGMEVLRGKMVVELKPRHLDKARAVWAYLTEAPFEQRRPWFCGDDVGDESAFRAVQGLGGVAVKVGAGASGARHRLPDPAAVRVWLQATLSALAAPAASADGGIIGADRQQL